ncbi:MAG: hypothetical protein HGA23_05820 [Bacteroidales bacterium]|nr:hypothetical protein [Bacteroidales bacterium]
MNPGESYSRSELVTIPFALVRQYYLFVVSDVNGNDNGMIEPGENILLHIELKNWGNGDAVNTSASLSIEDEYVSITDDYEDYGTITAQDSVMQMDAFQFQVSDFVPDMHLVSFNLNIQDETRESWGSTFSVTLFAPVMQVGSMSVDDSQGGNGNYRLDPGETVNFIVECHNSGHCDAYEILTVLQSSSPYITLENTSFNFDTLSWNGMKQAVFTATLAEEIETGTLIDLTVNLTSAPYSHTQLFNVPVGLIIEDFETGNFENFSWEQGGTQPWTITTEDVFEGLYSSRSGVIGNDQTSEISLEMNVSINDSISFFRKVSCEDDPSNDDYDWLGFFIDDIEIDRWDGEYGWGRVAYPVIAGPHTFKWVFNKDYSVASGQDAAWIDNVIFPAAAPVVAVEDAPGKMKTDFYIMPNPARNNTGLFVNMNASSAVSVIIYDLAGNKIKEAFTGKLLQTGANMLRHGQWFRASACISAS